MRVRDLEQRITLARQAALDNPPTTSYFVFFSNQKDAAIAAQTNLHAEDGHSFRVMEAPGPEEVRGAGGGWHVRAVVPQCMPRACDHICMRYFSLQTFQISVFTS